MRRVLAVSLGALVFMACSEGGLDLTSTDEISAAIVDGTSGAGVGNPDFFWLPPLVPNPRHDPEFLAPGEAFNPDLLPTVEVCADQPDPSMPCAMQELEVTAHRNGQHYQYDWKTNKGDDGRTFRVRVRIGLNVLGYFDAVLTKMGKGGSGNNVYVKAGRNLPIRFHIEGGALCTPAGMEPCASETLGLTGGGDVQLPSGSRVNVPAQQETNQVVTFTMQDCTDGDLNPRALDLPTFGPCISIITDPPLENPLDELALVSICEVDIGALPLSLDQRDLVTLHRLGDGGDVLALPHAQSDCQEDHASVAPDNGMLRLAWHGWNAIKTGVGRAFAGEPLHARRRRLDVGVGGRTPIFSDFQFALPAQMIRLSDSSRTAIAGSDLPTEVKIVDADAEPVAGATVRFTIIDGTGTAHPLTVVTGTEGIASTAWTIGGGFNELSANGRGIAAPHDNGPFMPDISKPTSLQDIVTVPTNRTAVFAADGMIYTIEQNGYSLGSVTPLVGTEDIDSFYSYDNPVNASSDTGLEMKNTSILFLYEDGMGTTSLVMIHDKPGDGTGGSATFTFSDQPAGALFVVKDGEQASEGKLPVSIWQWNGCCTDGGALSGGFSEAFDMSIAPIFPSSGGTPSGKIQTWLFLTGDLNSPTFIDLSKTKTLRIRLAVP